MLSMATNTSWIEMDPLEILPRKEAICSTIGVGSEGGLLDVF